jgi:hypothetical protein
MKKAIFPVLATVCLLLVAGLVICGCEKSSAIGFLSVSPSMVALEGMTNNVTFNVSVDSNYTGAGVEFADVLNWNLSDDNLGWIARTAGNSALYMRTPEIGTNYLYVRDAYDREGWAVIYQY